VVKRKCQAAVVNKLNQLSTICI